MRHRWLIFLLISASLTLAIPNEIIYSIVESGQIGELKVLSAKGVNFDIQNNEGATPLMIAVIAKNDKACEYLINEGVNITIRDNLGNDALDWALITHNLKIASTLAVKGADVNRRYSNGSTRLVSFIKRGNLPAVNFLLDYGADPQNTGSYNTSILKIAEISGFSAIINLINTYLLKEPSQTDYLQRISSSAQITHPTSSTNQHQPSRFTNGPDFFKSVQTGRKTFSNCTLQSLDLSKMNLVYLDMRKVDLKKSDLRSVNLKYTNLSGADLRGCYLKGADLRGADLTGADLTNAHLNNANLKEVQGLTLEQLRSTASMYRADLDTEMRELVEQYMPAKMASQGPMWNYTEN